MPTASGRRAETQGLWCRVAGIAGFAIWVGRWHKVTRVITRNPRYPRPGSDPPRAVTAEALLPEALALGRNAETGVSVYLGMSDGAAVYCGISCNLAVRAAQHGSRFESLAEVTMGSVTRGEARAIEQALIVRNPEFQNIRNSISPTHAWYQRAVGWGEEWLKAHGF